MRAGVVELVWRKRQSSAPEEVALLEAEDDEERARKEIRTGMVVLVEVVLELDEEWE